MREYYSCRVLGIIACTYIEVHTVHTYVLKHIYESLTVITLPTRPSVRHCHVTVDLPGPNQIFS